MAKFTKLNIGDAVASSGGRVWRKLSAESGEEESIVGTWVFGSVYYYPAFSTSLDFTSFDDDIADYVNYTSITLDTSGDFGLLKYNNTTVAREGTGFFSDGWSTIVINAEPTDAVFIEWLKANATKIA